MTSWTPKSNQNSPKITYKRPEISIKWLCWFQSAYRWVFWGWKTDFDVRILTFWHFDGVRRYYDVKYDVMHHEIVQNVTQMMLEFQLMIELSWKFSRIHFHIFIRGTRWWCQNSNILTYWRLKTWLQIL